MDKPNSENSVLPVHYSAALAGGWLCNHICQKGIPHAVDGFHDVLAQIQSLPSDMSDYAATIQAELYANDHHIPAHYYAGIYFQVQTCLNAL